MQSSEEYPSELMFALYPTAASEHLSPALLSKARALAAEHENVSKQLGEGFSINLAKKLGQLSATVYALREWDQLKESHRELDDLLRDPAADSELRALAAEDLQHSTDQLARASQSLTASLVPQHPFAHLPCLIEIRPGAGGSEAALFAADLLRMYRAYCARNRLRCSLIKYEDAEGAADPIGSDLPLAEAILEVESEGAYDMLRCEAGVHRVQRVPATESKGRTHTSAASVLVLPSFPGADEKQGEAGDINDSSNDYYIDPKEVRTEVMKARGSGGQHVNTTDSAIRLTHLPTKTVVSIQDQRSQSRNRDKAWKLLRSRLAQSRREAREEEMLQMRRSVVGVAKVGRGDKIRTYNWSQQRVTDHRSGFSVHDLNDVIGGGDTLAKVMESVRNWSLEQEVKALIVGEDRIES
ncbi:release factor [Viridothelium virens]|uniref:Release factor n=1 Tax=Viridothelium virens TaxID=1048519 RepID=A0A6A6H0X7_VIRVR|nr:release factor [Viridothelium virens]